MPLILSSSLIPSTAITNKLTTSSNLLPSCSYTTHRTRKGALKFRRPRAFFNPFEDQPIAKEAFKEPVAFLGGVFAGLLRLDLNEEPLKEWISKTVEAAGISEEGSIDAEELKGDGEDGAPVQIEIE